MSLEHKNVRRVQDEYMCLHCGRSWDVMDKEPPACEVAAQPVVHTPPARVLRQCLNAPAVTNCAWLVSSLSDPHGDFGLIYAEDRDSALRYAKATIGTELVSVQRLKAMDSDAYGRAPYFEMNPVKLRKAHNAARRPVLSLIKLRGLWA